MRTARWLVPLFLLVALLMFLRAPYLIDAAPEEKQLGIVQKIFYFHVASAITAMLSAILSGAASGVYLGRRRPLADHIGIAAAELRWAGIRRAGIGAELIRRCARAVRVLVDVRVADDASAAHRHSDTAA